MGRNTFTVTEMTTSWFSSEDIRFGVFATQNHINKTTGSATAFLKSSGRQVHFFYRFQAHHLSDHCWTNMIVVFPFLLLLLPTLPKSATHDDLDTRTSRDGRRKYPDAKSRTYLPVWALLQFVFHGLARSFFVSRHKSNLRTRYSITAWPIIDASEGGRKRMYLFRHR